MRLRLFRMSVGIAMITVWLVPTWFGVLGLRAAQVEHLVKKDDTLWDISDDYYTNPFLWHYVWKANLDRIANPHWIYPGQRIIIPPLPPEEMLVEMPIPSVEKEVPELELPIDVRAPTIPSVPLDFALTAGFLSQHEIQGPQIVETEPPGILNIISHQQVYLDWGYADGVKIGQPFTIFRKGRSVRHPKTGHRLGWIVDIVGTLEVTAIEERTARAQIVDCFRPIYIGDQLMAYDPPQVPLGMTLVDSFEDLSGYIVAFKDEEKTVMPFSVAYIDNGVSGGVKQGDVFQIVRQGRIGGGIMRRAGDVFPERVVGWLQVLSLQPASATAYIISIDNETDLRSGEQIRLVKRLEST